ncbi:hypothetical protein ACM66T_10265 [Sulfurimonas sp. ST-25]|uniref:hypothetical protein n=1 Tax=Sulfurimonas sp. ST-25 TaxID=3400151 RepID=UPI003A8B7556
MFKYVAYTTAEDEFTRYEFIELDDRTNVHRFSVPVVSVEYADEQAFADLIAHQPVQIGVVEITAEEFAAQVEVSAQVKRIRNMGADLMARELEPLSVRYPQEERDTWPSQLEEARAYQASGLDADAPNLKKLADAEGDTVESFALAVLAKKAAFDDMWSTALSHKRIFVRDALAAVGVGV